MFVLLVFIILILTVVVFNSIQSNQKLESRIDQLTEEVRYKGENPNWNGVSSYIFPLVEIYIKDVVFHEDSTSTNKLISQISKTTGVEERTIQELVLRIYNQSLKKGEESETRSERLNRGYQAFLVSAAICYQKFDPRLNLNEEQSAKYSDIAETCIKTIYRDSLQEHWEYVSKLATKIFSILYVEFLFSTNNCSCDEIISKIYKKYESLDLDGHASTIFVILNKHISDKALKYTKIEKDDAVSIIEDIISSSLYWVLISVPLCSKKGQVFAAMNFNQEVFLDISHDIIDEQLKKLKGEFQKQLPIGDSVYLSILDTINKAKLNPDDTTDAFNWAENRRAASKPIYDDTQSLSYHYDNLRNAG